MNQGAVALEYAKFEQLEIIPKYNVRKKLINIGELAKSIEANGVIVPLHAKKIVSEDGGVITYQITQGHRRMKAIERLHKKGVEVSIPIILEPEDITEEQLTISLTESNGGEPLTMLERSAVYKRLKDMGMNLTQIGKAVGKSATHVKDALTLLKASPELQKQINSGEISPTAALEQLKHSSSEEVEENLKKAKKAQTKTTTRSGKKKKVTQTQIANASGKGKTKVVKKKVEKATAPVEKEKTSKGKTGNAPVVSTTSASSLEERLDGIRQMTLAVEGMNDEQVELPANVLNTLYGVLEFVEGNSTYAECLKRITTMPVSTEDADAVLDALEEETV